MIPRALARVFQTRQDNPNTHYSIYISYLELYNEAGYDLLDPSHETKALEELPYVPPLTAADLARKRFHGLLWVASIRAQCTCKSRAEPLVHLLHTHGAGAWR
ncbi:MAG: hypothetical protein EOO65_03440 [Methanosarcinales archaeon]|nr:MAG: hypothetical protein EOO65_03440 [Methanosarcinales archaeon]